MLIRLSSFVWVFQLGLPKQQPLGMKDETVPKTAFPFGFYGANILGLLPNKLSQFYLYKLLSSFIINNKLSIDSEPKLPHEQAHCDSDKEGWRWASTCFARLEHLHGWSFLSLTTFHRYQGLNLCITFACLSSSNGGRVINYAQLSFCMRVSCHVHVSVLPSSEFSIPSTFKLFLTCCVSLCRHFCLWGRH